MQRLDWYPWHWKNWRLSEARELMSATERGIYRELLDVCWANGSFALDIPRLARSCGATEQELADAWPLLQTWFEQRSDGRWFNANMAVITQEQADKHATMLARAKKGGSATKAKWQGRKKDSSIASSIASSVQKERKIERSFYESSTTPLPLEEGGRVLCNCGGASRKSGIHSPSCAHAPGWVSGGDLRG